MFTCCCSMLFSLQTAMHFTIKCTCVNTVNVINVNDIVWQLGNNPVYQIPLKLEGVGFNPLGDLTWNDPPLSKSIVQHANSDNSLSCRTWFVFLLWRGIGSSQSSYFQLSELKPDNELQNYFKSIYLGLLLNAYLLWLYQYICWDICIF